MEQVTFGERIVVDAIVNNNVEKVWEAYVNPEHITKWAFADDSWHAPRATNDLRIAGTFLTRMEAKDGSQGFDFVGKYDDIEPLKKIAYTMSDGRKAEVTFEEMGNSTHVRVSFDPENQNPPEFQKSGWQAILDNFKKHAESL